VCYRSGVRRLVLVIVLMVGGVAYAQPAEPAPSAAPAPSATMPEAPRTMRQREILTERPSGFWTSNRPAQGGRYRWRLLGLGVGIAALTGFAMWRLVRKANAERATRQ